MNRFTVATSPLVVRVRINQPRRPRSLRQTRPTLSRSRDCLQNPRSGREALSGGREILAPCSSGVLGSLIKPRDIDLQGTSVSWVYWPLARDLNRKMRPQVLPQSWGSFRPWAVHCWTDPTCKETVQECGPWEAPGCQ
jgi:hypothetical protein